MLLFKLRKVQFCHQAAFVVHRESVAPKLESQRDSNINKVIYRLHKRALKCVCVCVCVCVCYSPVRHQTL